jgi:alanyl-tRNA synthetase
MMWRASGHDIRRAFLGYFERHGHRIVKSSPLVLPQDPTLLFANAGMNQFKNVFLGLEERDYTRAASAQKCVRAGGKHNDLEQVGKTARHHTFFEMLGNFSFGDYFKEEAIWFAWDLLVNEWQLPLERLWFTVYEEDDEAAALWRKMGAAPDRILRFGVEENFWAMGETGPCGPCSEVHVFIGEDPAYNRAEYVNGPGDHIIEIWNLVFMQFNRDESGALTLLPKPSVDTGMGLERIAAVLQGVTSNYDTDLLRPLLERIAALAGRDYVSESDEGMSMRVIADHARATAFLVADGVFPGNEQRAYVLRKIMRRALWHGRKLGIPSPFFHVVTDAVVEMMAPAYPELLDARATIERVVRREEHLFASTLSAGLRKFDEILERTSGRRISGTEAFTLYDTYGLREDLIEYIAAQRGYTVDWEGFQAALEEQRQRALAAWKKTMQEKSAGMEAVATVRELETRFLGYDQTECSARVQALFVNGQSVDRVAVGQQVDIVLDQTPFYAESGGQVGDTGVIESEGARALVLDTVSKTFAEDGTATVAKYVHVARIEAGELRVGDRVWARIDVERRERIRPHHTATHLLHAALREVLGPHVKQAGSLVAPDRLRFDFTHFAPLAPEEIKAVEDMVNAQILRNVEVVKVEMELERALHSGALAFFGEKYGSRVRVVEVPGFSKELCGGTHVARTGDIGLFKIVKEESIGAGIRRIEAVCGRAALERFQEDEARLMAIAELLRTTPAELPAQVERLQAELKRLEREVEVLRLRLAAQAVTDILHSVREVRGVKVLAERVEGLDPSGLRELADRLLQKLASGVIVLGQTGNGKATLLVRVSRDLVPPLDAGKIVRELAAIIGGRGGGRPDLAEAGGRDPERLPEALEAAYRIVAEMLTAMLSTSDAPGETSS